MNYSIDYYHILTVGKAASKEELKAAYRKLVKLHHPDKNPGDAEATSRFQLIQEAYEILSNDISRHVYDEYRAEHAKAGEARTEKAAQPNSRSFTRTNKVWREKRVYVQGRVNVKFQGIPELEEAYLAGGEQKFTIWPTETLLTILSSGIYKNGTPKEYDKSYSSAELFAVQLPQPLRCRVMMGGVEEIYDLSVHDLKIRDPSIINVTRHERDHFGELTGDCYGYIVHRYEEEVTETFTEYYGSTGQAEVKEAAGVYFTRQQFYAKDGSVYWGEWVVNTSATTRARATTRRKANRYPTPPRNDISPKYVRYEAWSFPWLSVLFFILLCGFGIRSLLHPSPAALKFRPRQYQPLDTHREPLNHDKGNSDTLISHLVQWSDYDSNRYDASLRILQSSVTQSYRDHQALPFGALTADRVGEVYARMYHMDSGRLNYVYQTFDSIVKVKHLSELQAASMVVSCIQSIPYFLIVDGSCNANYNDAFITNYLRNCQHDCCLGDVKFGVQTPAEFIGDLKGDCDTRALVLFDILSKMGYDVAVLTSQYFKHALVAVHFKHSQIADGLSIPVKGKNYYLWETTSMGHKPGVIPAAISNLDHWKTSLLHQQ